MFDDQRIQGIDAMGAKLNAAFTAEEAVKARSPRPRRRRRLLVAAGFVCAAAIAALAISVGLPGEKALDVETALADVANKLEIMPQPTADQFDYTKSRGSRVVAFADPEDALGRPTKDFLMRAPVETEFWGSADNGTAMIMRSEAPEFITEQDKARGAASVEAARKVRELAKTAEGRSELGGEKATRRALAISASLVPYEQRARFGGDGTYMIGALGQFTKRQLDAFPRDPKAVYEKVAGMMSPEFEQPNANDQRYSPTAVVTPDDFVWSGLTNDRDLQPVPIDLRAAMVKALAYVPGVKAEGDTEDAFGRKGVKFSRVDEGVRDEVVFDAETSVILSTTQTVVDPAQLTPNFRHLSAGTVLSSYELIDKKTVGEVPDLRAGD